MKRTFEKTALGGMELPNSFVFPPIKLAYGNPEGVVTDRQLVFYGQIAKDGPGLLILEPVAVTLDGKEHPKQLCVHLPESERELKKIVDVVHENGRRACLHLNHAGAGANPMVTKTDPKAPSSVACPAREHTARALTGEEIDAILKGYSSAAEKAVNCGFDAIEVQAGHGYLVSQFLNSKINVREDSYGEDRLLFIRQALSMIKEVSRGTPLILRISGNEMSPEFGISREDLQPLFKLAEDEGVSAIHVGMGNTCFSPPWYFHHGSLPEKPQMDSLAWIRENTTLPLIVAGRMGRKEKIEKVFNEGLADFIALGRPLIADPGLLKKWHDSKDQEAVLCGYCLQGCFHRVKSGEGLGCNFNPLIGRPEPGPAEKPLNVLVAGGGPAGMSAAAYLSLRGHHVTLGGTRPLRADVHVLAATNKDLADLVRAGKFREDLFYRINVVRLKLPPLRQRKEDIPILVKFFIDRMNRLRGRSVTGISREALAVLMHHHYPGNIRELENIIEHALVICPEGQIGCHCLPDYLQVQAHHFAPKEGMGAALRSTEARLILDALKASNYNRIEAAKRLEMHKSTLYRKIKKLGVLIPKRVERARRR